MARTVVGLFQSQNEARSVKQDLIEDGYSADSVRVIAQDENSKSAAASASGSNREHETGFAATISNFFSSLTGASDSDDEKEYAEGVGRGRVLLAVTVPDERADAAAAVLERYGAKNVNEKSAATFRDRPGYEGQTVNVVEEELEVGKRQIQRGGVRVYSHVNEHPVEETIQLREEHVRVDRRQVDRPAAQADFDAFQERTIELTETAEEAVVSKTATVVEEITIGTNVTERRQTIEDTVRRSDVAVEELEPDRREELAGKPADPAN